MRFLRQQILQFIICYAIVVGHLPHVFGLANYFSQSFQLIVETLLKYRNSNLWGKLHIRKLPSQYSVNIV